MSKDTVLSALLDYYSDKASAEASAVVATTFGLFVILTATNHRPEAFWIYWGLWSAGLYFLMGFGYWAHLANRTKSMLAERIPTHSAKDIDKKIERFVKGEWKKTFLRNLYLWTKHRGELKPRRWVSKQRKPEPEGIRFGDVLPFLFLLFGLYLSHTFFQDETWSFQGIIPLSILTASFIFDLISISFHRSLRGRKEKTDNAKHKE